MYVRYEAHSTLDMLTLFLCYVEGLLSPPKWQGFVFYFNGSYILSPVMKLMYSSNSRRIIANSGSKFYAKFGNLFDFNSKHDKHKYHLPEKSKEELQAFWPHSTATIKRGAIGHHTTWTRRLTKGMKNVIKYDSMCALGWAWLWWNEEEKEEPPLGKILLCGFKQKLYEHDRVFWGNPLG